MSQPITYITDTSTLTVQSVDGHLFGINNEIANFSHTIENASTDIESDEPVPLLIPPATGDNVYRILTCLKHMHEHPQETESLKTSIAQRASTGFPPQFINFIDVDKKTIFELLILADYLDIEILVDFISLTIANQIKRMTPEEVQATFSA